MNPPFYQFPDIVAAFEDVFQQLIKYHLINYFAT